MPGKNFLHEGETDPLTVRFRAKKRREELLSDLLTDSASVILD